jgi:hypothetical protein
MSQHPLTHVCALAYMYGKVIEPVLCACIPRTQTEKESVKKRRRHRSLIYIIFMRIMLSTALLIIYRNRGVVGAIGAYFSCYILEVKTLCGSRNILSIIFTISKHVTG